MHTRKAAGLTTLQFHAHCEGMMVVVREQFAAGGAEGTETLVLSVGLVSDRKTLRQSELRLSFNYVVCLRTTLMG